MHQANLIASPKQLCGPSDRSSQFGSSGGAAGFPNRATRSLGSAPLACKGIRCREMGRAPRWIRAQKADQAAADDRQREARYKFTQSGKLGYEGESMVPQVVRAIRASDWIRKLPEVVAGSSGESVLATACNVADSLIGALLAPGSLKPGNDPEVQMSGNCAPVTETPPTACVVEGRLPEGLSGVYVRNGPNASHVFEREGYHMFDGDGMLHAVRIAPSGAASYCARYVRTSRFVQEEMAGRPLFVKFFGGFRGFIGFARGGLVLLRALLGVLNMSDGWGLSNTSVCFFNHTLLSLSEDDMPYALRITPTGDLLTLGRLKFPAPAAPALNMCAHPKFHPHSGDMFAFTFTPSLRFSFFKVSSHGVRSPAVHIPLRGISFIHDFAITQRFAVFPDNQFVFKPLKVLRGQLPVVCDKNKTPMFCLLPLQALEQRQPGSDPRSSTEVISAPTNSDRAPSADPLWFEAPGCNAYHYLNAWEEEDEVVIITPVISPPECFLELPAKSMACTLTEVRLNLTTGLTSVTPLCPGSNLEFGTFNQNYTGRKTRYVYLASGCYPELTALVKVDLQKKSEPSCIVAVRDFGPSCHGNEPCFVPRKSSIDGGGEGEGEGEGEEDDGYLLCIVHNGSTGVSRLLVMDAQSPSLAILASIRLPSRVPYGFHGCFVREAQLAEQL